MNSKMYLVAEVALSSENEEARSPAAKETREGKGDAVTAAARNGRRSIGIFVVEVGLLCRLVMCDVVVVSLVGVTRSCSWVLIEWAVSLRANDEKSMLQFPY